MKTHTKKLQLLTVTCLVLFTFLYVWNRGAAGQKEVKLPKVISEAKNIEVINVKAEEPDLLIVTVRNNSEKPVIALTLETGNSTDGQAVSVVGYQEGDEPDKIIIRPHETYNMDMPLSYVLPDELVRVSGVIYADDTGEGVKNILELMRNQKKHVKSKRLKPEKGAPQSWDANWP